MERPSHNRQVIKHVRGFAFKVAAAIGFGLLAAFLLMLNALLVWVATGPRDLSRALPYIEHALSGVQSGYTVKINRGLLLWDGWEHPIDIRLRGIDIYTSDGHRFATFPDVSLGLDLFALAIGRIEPTSLVVRYPVISLFQDKHGHVSFGLPAQDSAKAGEQAPGDQGAVLSALAEGFMGREDASPLHKLRRLQVEDADVSVGSQQRGVFLKAQNVQLILRRGWRGTLVKADADILQNAPQGRPAHVAADFRSGSADGRLEGKVRVDSIWLPAFAPLVNDTAVLPAMQFLLSGWAEASITGDGTVTAHYLLQGDKGTLESKLLEKPIAVQHVQAEGGVQGRDHLSLDHFAINLGTYAVQGAAQIARLPAGLALKGNASAQGVPLADVRRFWPVGLAPLSRSWVVDNVTEGTAQLASIAVNIPAGALDAPVLPEGAIDARVNFENATLRYLPKHPPVKALSGVLHVNAKSLEAKVAHGIAMGNTQLSAGRVYIDDLNLDNPRIEVEAEAQAPAADVLDFLALPPIEASPTLKLNHNTATGMFTGKAKVAFYYFVPLDKSGKPRDDLGVDYQVAAQMKDGGQPGFMGRFDISHANGELEVDNTHLHYAGTGVVNGATASKGDVLYRFRPQDGIDTVIAATVSAPVESLKRFGYPEMPFLSGALQAEVNLEEGPDTERATAHIGLKDTDINWKKLRWKKPAGQAATLELTSERKGNTLRIPQFSYTAHDADIKGSAAFAEGFTLSSLSMQPFRLGNDDATLQYDAIPGGYQISAHGSALDISGLMEGSDDFSFARFPALKLSASVKTLVISPKAAVTGVEASVDCTDICTRADVTGHAEGKPFSFHISGASGDGRTVTAKADDAGAFLRALDVYDDMRGGQLAMTGKYNDAKSTHPLSGVLTINDYTVEHAPVLAKLLSLASLSGLLDSLSGHGISFDKLKAPFTLENDVITVKDMKTHGDAVGLTADGTIRFPGQVFDIRGTVVPAYSVNSLLGHVPLLGDVLTGGGGGVFAARYSVKGPHGNPDVSVNPLSVLTPGFLRNVFDIFDKDDSAPAAPVEDKNSKEK